MVLSKQKLGITAQLSPRRLAGLSLLLLTLSHSTSSAAQNGDGAVELESEAPSLESAPQLQADILIGDADTPPGTPARPVRPGELQPLPSCPVEPFDLRGIRDKPEIEAFMAARIQESFALNGAVDWDCLVLRFDAALGERTSVEIYRRVNEDWGDAYHFNLNRRSLFRWWWPTFGGSNGIFTATVSARDDGRVFIVKRGGEREWLKLE